MFDLADFLQADWDECGMNMIELSDDEYAAFRESVHAELMCEVEGSCVPEGLITRVQEFIDAQ